MCDDVDPEFALLVLDQVDVGVDTLGLVSLRQLGCGKLRSLRSWARRMRRTDDRRVCVNPAYRDRLEDESKGS